MTTTPAWRRYLRFWRSDIADDVDDELRFHTEMRVAEYVARGMTEDDARRAVTTRLGDVDAARVECIALGHVRETHARRADFLDGLRADVRFALRSLRGTPGWTAVALLTIALGVGATTTVFSVADALLVRPLPYPDASRVFMARREFTVDGNRVPASLPFGVVREWREYARTIDAAVPFSSNGPATLRTPDAVTVHSARIDTAFLAFAGVRPLIGRNFSAEEIAVGGPGALLLTEQFWRRQYGASREVIGRVVRLDDRPRTIVGVVPASLSIPDFRSERADVLVPLLQSPNQGVVVLVRLRPGIAPTVAAAELDAILARAHVLDVKPVPMPMPVRLTRPQDWLAIRQPLAMLTGAVGLLLLVACTNVAHLLLARGAARQRELAVRHALGAGRSRLLRQLITESVVLAVYGGGFAVVVGWAGLHVLAALRPASFVALTYVATDRGILSISATLAILAGLAVGLFAALRSAHRDLGTSLRLGASSMSRSSRRLRSSLVVGEVALSATLLVGALLLIHAVFDLERTNLGFDAQHLYTVTFLPGENEPAAEHAAFAALVRERATALPGVRSVSAGSSIPGAKGFRMIAAFETPEHPEVAPASASGSVGSFSVAGDYFAMIGMPLLAGHGFDEGSVDRHEVVVSASLARLIWPDGNAIGRQFRNAVSRSRGVVDPWHTVIGIVPDIVTNLVEGVVPALYQPEGPPRPGVPSGTVTLLVRIDGADAGARLRTFAAAMQRGRPDAILTNVRDLVDASAAEPRFLMRVLAAFAALGVLLSAIGLFGVISYDVGQRTREIGVRMTLGATRASIARLVIGDATRLALLGIVTGLAGAVAATRLIQRLLYGVSPLDPFAFGMGAMVLLAVSVVACVVPMLRATAVDPARAIRAD